MRTLIAVLTPTLAAIAGGLAGASSAQASETDSMYAVSTALTGSLRRWPGDSARTAELCVGADRTIVRSDTGTCTDGTTLDTSRSGWQGPPGASVPDHATNTVQQISIAFVSATPYDSVQTVLVDDVLIDPWRSRNG